MATPMSTSLHGKGSDVLKVDSPKCEPCSVENQSIPAYRLCDDCQEYLCQRCSKHHLSLRMAYTHTLLSLDEVNKTPKRTLKDKCSEKCDVHKDKTIKWFCEAHVKLGCSVCKATSHKHCDETVYIPTAAENIAHNSEFKTFNGNLQALDKAIKISIEDVKKALNQIETDETNLNIAFKTFRKQLNDAIDQLENESTVKAKRIREGETNTLNAIALGLENLLDEADALVKAIDKNLKEGKQCNVFVTMKKHEAQLIRLTKELEVQKNDKKFNRYMFIPDRFILMHNIGLGRFKQNLQLIPWSAPTVPTLNMYWMVMAERMKVGDRVRRGRDWPEDNNEDDEGLGTVLQNAGRGSWVVRWDCDRRGTYNMKTGWFFSSYQLEIV